MSFYILSIIILFGVFCKKSRDFFYLSHFYSDTTQVDYLLKYTCVTHVYLTKCDSAVNSSFKFVT